MQIFTRLSLLEWVDKERMTHNSIRTLRISVLFRRALRIFIIRIYPFIIHNKRVVDIRVKNICYIKILKHEFSYISVLFPKMY